MIEHWLVDQMRIGTYTCTCVGAEMGNVSYTDLRQNLARCLDELVESRAPIVVTRQGGKANVVLMSGE